MLLTNAASRSIQLRRASPFGVTLRSSLLMPLAFPHCPVSTDHLTFRLKASFDRTFSFLSFLSFLLESNIPLRIFWCKKSKRRCDGIASILAVYVRPRPGTAFWCSMQALCIIRRMYVRCCAVRLQLWRRQLIEITEPWRGRPT